MTDTDRIFLERIENSDRGTLENLFQFYLYDMSEFVSIRVEMSGQFQFDPKQLDKYWTEEGCSPYLIKYKSELAGFLLVRQYPSDKAVMDIEQFFVMRSFRRLGVGQRALKRCLIHHPGRWQIRVLLENRPAYMFWKRAIASITGCEFSVSEDIDEDLQMYFFRFEYKNS